MAVIIDPSNAIDIDQPLNTSPDFTSVHVYSTADVTGTYSGLTQGDVAPGETPVIDFSATPLVAKDGTNLYPINSEFGFIVTDFVGAEEKDFVLNPEYAEGWAGDITGTYGQQIGITVSDSPTDTFKTPAVLGTWLSGLGGNTVKASTEHYVVMQNVLSDQKYPGDPDAVYPLDNDLYMIGGAYDGWLAADAIADAGDANGDGVADLKDVLEPNETEIDINIAASADYSVTLKDDGKLLYRWGNTIKKPNDIRLEATLDLPSEWDTKDSEGDLQPLYKITAAELVTHHLITNNPNDQIRPEDFENEFAIGTLPTYEILADGSWVTTDDYYAGDGTLYPAGTVLKDPALAAAWATSDMAAIGAIDGAEGFTNAWYTTMDREPFEPELNADGTEYVVGPRWRLQPDKYGQDLPSVVIPEDPSTPPPVKNGEEKYIVGAETQTVINLLDWENPFSPLAISAGWQNAAGTVTDNGLNMTSAFDVAVYVKGDIKPTSIYSSELVLSYEEITTYAAGETISGGAGEDYLVGQGGNTMTGGAESDFFVLSYGAPTTADIQNSVITDFIAGEDVIGLIGLEVTPLTVDTIMADTNITQTVVGGDLQLAIDGVDLVTLQGVTEFLTASSFLTMTPGESNILEPMLGTAGDDVLVGTAGDDIIDGLEGNDRLIGLAGADQLDGGAGADTVNGGDGDDVLTGGDAISDAGDVIIGGLGDDTIDGGAGNDLIYGGDGDDVIDGGTGADTLLGQDGNDQLTGTEWGDMLSGGDGFDFLNGGYGNDRLTGGADADRFYHAGSSTHGTDWVKDYTATEGDVLLYGAGGATAADFSVHFANTGAGDAAIDEAFVTFDPTGQVLWTLIDGAGDTEINLSLYGNLIDLLA